jgi:hypothetical protein
VPERAAALGRGADERLLAGHNESGHVGALDEKVLAVGVALGDLEAPEPASWPCKISTAATRSNAPAIAATTSSPAGRATRPRTPKPLKSGSPLKAAQRPLHEVDEPGVGRDRHQQPLPPARVRLVGQHDLQAARLGAGAAVHLALKGAATARAELRSTRSGSRRG